MYKQIFFVFMLISVNVFSQNSITNVLVIDKQTSEILPFCHICIENKVDGKADYFTTNTKGKAEFTYTGKTVISISFIGYKTIIDTLNSYKKNKIYKLIAETFNIEEVVVTGQNKPISIDKSIYSIKLIGKEKVELQASNNLAELLSNELNIQINNDPSTGSSVKLQGISGENVKILVDGVPLIGRMDGNIDLSQVNLDEVDHIEIVEGPMSVMYGSNALAGVINIITKENKYAKLKTGIDTYYETVGTYSVNGNLYLKNKRNSIGLNIGRNFFGGYSPEENSRSQQWKPKEQYKAGLYYTYQKNKLKLKYKIDGFRERLLSRNNPSPPYYNKGNDIWFYTIRLNNSFQVNYSFTEYSSFDLMLSYSYYNREKQKYAKDLTTLETTLSPNATDHDTTIFNAYVARGVYNFNNPSKKISYQLGFDFNAETADGKRIKNNYQQIGDYAGFASMQWNINKNIVIQPALRASYNTKYTAPLTPSLNFKYQLSKTNFRLSYSRGFRAPSLKELYLYFYDSNHQIEGNDNLKAENSHNYNVAITHKNKIYKKPIELKLKGFYNQINDMITLVQVSEANGLHYRNGNIGEFESIGGTFTFNIRPKSFLDINAGISETGTRDNYFSAKDFNFSSNANASVTIKLLKNTMAFSVFYKYIGRYPQYFYGKSGDLELGYINDYHNMDITLSKKFFKNKLTISTGVKNLFDNVSVNGVVSGGTGAHSGGSSASLVGWGRTFFVGLKYNFSKY